jgi:hypothetical protein
MIPRRLVLALVTALLMAAPSVASACPACLGNPRNMSVLKLVGVLILTPFVVFGTVLWAVRRADTTN